MLLQILLNKLLIALSLYKSRFLCILVHHLFKSSILCWCDFELHITLWMRSASEICNSNGVKISQRVKLSLLSNE